MIALMVMTVRKATRLSRTENTGGDLHDVDGRGIKLTLRLSIVESPTIEDTV